MSAKTSGIIGKFLLILALCFIGAGYAQAQPGGTTPRPMTAEEAADYAYLLPLLRPGKPYVLNLADPRQQRIALRGLMQANRTPQNAPQTHAAFQAAVRIHAQQARSKKTTLTPMLLAAPAPGSAQDIAVISNFGDDGNNVYTATGLSSVIGGTTQTTIKMDLIDTKTNTVYGTTSDTQFALGTNFQVPVFATVADPANLAAVATITTTVGSVQKTVVVSTASSIPAGGATMTEPNYCVRNGNICVIENGQTKYQTTSTTLVPSPPPIKICFARGSQQDCDYFNNTIRPVTSVFFPAAGTAAFGANTVDPSYATVGQFTASIVDPVVGGGCVFTGPLGAGWSLANPSTLQWNLPQLSLTNPTQCLIRSGGHAVNFIFYVEAPLKTAGGNSTGFVTLSSASPPKFPGNYGIPQLYLEDSCVAAGTLVRLADGTETAIEKLTADDKPSVKTASGDALPVLGTVKGVELHPMIRLKTDLGQQLLITRTHPVVTDNGLVMARDLKVGDRLKTEKGVARIVSNATEKYTGLVHSLRLGWFDEAKSERRTHSANGIFIGDTISQAQAEQEEIARLESDRAHVERRLPDDKWRAEYRAFRAQRR